MEPWLNIYSPEVSVQSPVLFKGCGYKSNQTYDSAPHREVLSPCYH